MVTLTDVSFAAFWHKLVEPKGATGATSGTGGGPLTYSVCVIVFVTIQELLPWVRSASELSAHDVPCVECLDVVILKRFIRQAGHPSQAIELNAIVVVLTQVIICCVQIIDFKSD